MPVARPKNRQPMGCKVRRRHTHTHALARTRTHTHPLYLCAWSRTRDGGLGFTPSHRRVMTHAPTTIQRATRDDMPQTCSAPLHLHVPVLTHPSLEAAALITKHRSSHAAEPDGTDEDEAHLVWDSLPNTVFFGTVHDADTYHYCVVPRDDSPQVACRRWVR